LKKISICWN